MEIKKFKLPSAQDALPLSIWIALPENGAARAVFQISHGMSEHKERYQALMEYLCGYGFACVIHDHRGHGESVRSTDDYGYFYKDGADALIEDLHQVSLFAKKQFPNLPFFLFGHSMGSMAVRCYLKQYDYELNGLIVCGSPSYNPASLAGQILAEIIGAIRGSHYRSGLLQTLSFGSFPKKFSGEQSQNSWLSSSNKSVEIYDQDPQCGFVFTANGFQNLYRLMRKTYSRKGWQLRHSSLPIYFISGADDPCLINKEKFINAVSFLKARGYYNTTYHLYPGKRHEILNEDIQSQVLEDIHTFCENQISF